VAHLKETLEDKGHKIGDTAVREILLSLHYSLKPNKKNLEGVSHPDRDAQFEHLNAQCAAFERAGNPILSIDCKKKEQMGNFKNNGKEWVKRGSQKGENETRGKRNQGKTKPKSTPTTSAPFRTAWLFPTAFMTGSKSKAS
jgi:hypothetical protein